jgi:hypothetical protein
MGPTALFPLRRKACCGFLSAFEILRPRPAYNPQTLGLMVSTLTTRPLRTILSSLSSLDLILRIQQAVVVYVFMQKINWGGGGTFLTLPQLDLLESSYIGVYFLKLTLCSGAVLSSLR